VLFLQPEFRLVITSPASDHGCDLLARLSPADLLTKKRDWIPGRSSDHDPMPRDRTSRS
jgi:hypothetical protein